MTAGTGESGVMAAVLKDAKALLEAASVEEQLDLLEPPTPEEMAEARDDLGPDAGRLTVLKHAREKRRGRPKGSRNKRTDDFVKYLLGFGQHPGITMMQIQSTPPEVLIEASKQEKVHSFSKIGEPRIVIERLSYGEAQSLRIRCAEGLMPFFESKRPVSVDHTIRGVDVIEEAPRQLLGNAVDGEFVEVAPVDDDGDDT